MSSDPAWGGVAAGGDGRMRPPDGTYRAGRCNVLLLSFLSLGLIMFGLWTIVAGKRYREEYSNALDGWRAGSSREVEITLVKDDDRNLACASDHVVSGLRCGYKSNLQAAGPVSPDDPRMLQPYNTVDNELLLGAGLWTSPEMKQPLPLGRFSVVCTYDVKGMMRSAAIRFTPTGAFGPVGKVIPAGAFRDCTPTR
jgi:hypothetical protein